MSLLQRLRGLVGQGHDGSVRYRCEGCGREFVYLASVSDPDCPYCDASDTGRLADRAPSDRAE